MDLIGESPKLNLLDKNFRIFSRNFARPPQYLGESCTIKNSLVSEGCRIYGRVENSVLSGGVIVKEGALVKDSVIMDDVLIEEGAKVYTAIIDSEAVIGKSATVGLDGASKSNIVVVAKGAKIAPNSTVIQ